MLVHGAGGRSPLLPLNTRTRSRDTTKGAHLVGAPFIMLINTVVPISLTGGVGAKTVGLYDYVGALNHLVGYGRDELLRGLSWP